MELIQSQTQRLSQRQIQGVELLQMSAWELEACLRELAQENPVVELEEVRPEPEYRKEDELLSRLRWLEDNDRQNRFCQQAGEEELDPLARVGTAGGLEETLLRFLSRQLERMRPEEKIGRAARYLAACLDEDGYLRIPLAELAEDGPIPLAELERGLELLRSLEPAGVGASSLGQCLELQLERIHETGPALEIVRRHLEALARRRYRAIAARLAVPVEEVKRAEALIRELEPRPGAPFEQEERTSYILPDVYVEEREGTLSIRLRGEDRRPFQISGSYRRLLEQTGDRELKAYLTEKVRQAEGVLRALEQRDSTLRRCVRFIIERQRDFFRLGPRALTSLRMADAARELGVHESTVSRALREKYLQCSFGVYPLSYFFSRSAAQEGEMGGAAAKELLRRLIDGEDKRSPLSDQKLCERMAREGCPISRRTAAKYREELNIPSASGRREEF